MDTREIKIIKGHELSGKMTDKARTELPRVYKFDLSLDFTGLTREQLIDLLTDSSSPRVKVNQKLKSGNYSLESLARFESSGMIIAVETLISKGEKTPKTPEQTLASVRMKLGMNPAEFIEWVKANNL